MLGAWLCSTKSVDDAHALKLRTLTLSGAVPAAAAQRSALVAPVHTVPPHNTVAGTTVGVAGTAGTMGGVAGTRDSPRSARRDAATASSPTIARAYDGDSATSGGSSSSAYSAYSAYSTGADHVARRIASAPNGTASSRPAVPEEGISTTAADGAAACDLTNDDLAGSSATDEDSNGTRTVGWFSKGIRSVEHAVSHVTAFHCSVFPCY